jgi:hypothetical protein
MKIIPCLVSCSVTAYRCIESYCQSRTIVKEMRTTGTIWPMGDCYNKYRGKDILRLQNLV